MPQQMIVSAEEIKSLERVIANHQNQD